MTGPESASFEVRSERLLRLEDAAPDLEAARRRADQLARECGEAMIVLDVARRDGDARTRGVVYRTRKAA